MMRENAAAICRSPGAQEPRSPGAQARPRSSPRPRSGERRARPFKGWPSGLPYISSPIAGNSLSKKRAQAISLWYVIHCQLHIIRAPKVGVGPAFEAKTEDALARSPCSEPGPHKTSGMPQAPTFSAPDQTRGEQKEKAHESAQPRA